MPNAPFHPLSLTRYGPEQGYASFRQSLAGFLSSHYGHEVVADELIVTAGE
jgi:aspartate/methionine/tyrosine aminotransferase